MLIDVTVHGSLFAPPEYLEQHERGVSVPLLRIQSPAVCYGETATIATTKSGRVQICASLLGLLSSRTSSFACHHPDYRPSSCRGGYIQRILPGSLQSGCWNRLRAAEPLAQTTIASGISAHSG